jgi:ABC-2 type transport system permease protein
VSGGLVLLRKELLESWRTLRLPIVTGLFIVVGLTSPLLARFLPEIIEAAGGAQLGSIQIPTPVAADAASQLWKNLAQFGAIAAIVLAMSSVAAEKERGTAAFVLSKTVSRGAFLASKIVAIGAVLAVGVVLATAVAWFYTAVLFEPLPVAGWVAFAVLAWLGLAVWAAITFAGSAVTGSTAAAAGVGFVGFLVLSIASAIPTVSHYLPGGLAEPAVALAAGQTADGGDIATAVLGSVVVIVIALVVAAWSFRSQEL